MWTTTDSVSAQFECYYTGSFAFISLKLCRVFWFGSTVYVLFLVLWIVRLIYLRLVHVYTLIGYK